jgi:G patch domain-containing protein 2
MLQSMGWSPGQGLGADGAGIRTPVKACLRPRRQGFGSSEQPSTSWDGPPSVNSNTLTAEQKPGSKVELHSVSSEQCL